MGGQLVELDDKVWLLLTHYKLTHVHGLRVGAMVGVPTFILGFLIRFVQSLPHKYAPIYLRGGVIVQISTRHVHFVTLKNVTEKALLLGACLRSHVWVVLHSILNDM